MNVVWINVLEAVNQHCTNLSPCEVGEAKKMFLSTLNIEQQQAFLGLARLFVEADGQLASQEKAMLEVMKAEMGLSEDIEVPTDNLPNLLKPFDSKPAKAAALLEIIGLGYSDNDFHPQESILVKLSLIHI